MTLNRSAAGDPSPSTTDCAASGQPAAAGWETQWLKMRMACHYSLPARRVMASVMAEDENGVLQVWPSKTKTSDGKLVIPPALYTIICAKKGMT